MCMRRAIIKKCHCQKKTYFCECSLTLPLCSHANEPVLKKHNNKQKQCKQAVVVLLLIPSPAVSILDPPHEMKH